MSSDRRFSDRGSAVVGFASAPLQSLSQLLFPTSTVAFLTLARSSMFDGRQSMEKGEMILLGMALSVLRERKGEQGAFQAVSAFLSWLQCCRRIS